MLGFLIVFNGCGNDMEVPPGKVDNISHGARGNPVINLSGIIGRTTLKSTNVYTLTGGAVIVPSGTVLTIEPGTLIKGSSTPCS